MVKKARKWAKWLLLIWMCIAIILIPVNQVKAITKTETTQVMEWTKITNTGDSAGIVSTGWFNVADAIETVICVDWCLAEAQTHEGTEIIIQISSEAGVTDTGTTLIQIIALAGITPVKSDFASSEAPGQTVLSITNPETGDLDRDGNFIFLEDTSVPANCEIAYAIDNSGDAGDTVTVLDGITHAKDSDDDAWTSNQVNTSTVYTRAFLIPASASRARVIINNFYDPDGTAADGYGRVRVIKLTAL